MLHAYKWRKVHFQSLKKLMITIITKINNERKVLDISKMKQYPKSSTQFNQIRKRSLVKNGPSSTKDEVA